MKKSLLWLIVILQLAGASCAIAEHGAIYKRIAPGSKIYVDDDFLISGSVINSIKAASLPVTLVESKDDADYIVSGTAREHDPSYARTVVLTNSKMYETSIDVKNAHSGETVMTYSRDKRKASTEADDFAKELGRAIRSEP